MYLAMHGVVMPVVSLIGIVANVANVVVLSGVVKRYSASVYRVLLAIAIADLLLMAVVFFHGARFSMRERPVTRSDEAEQLDGPSYFFYHTWDTFANICGMASNWCVLMVTGLRLVAVYFPLRPPSARGRLRVVVGLPILFVVAVVVNLPWALVKPYDSDSGKFVLQKELHQGYKRDYYVVLLLLYHVIPWIAMAALAGLLLFGMRPAVGSRPHGGGQGDGDGSGLDAKLEQSRKQAQKMLSVTLASKAAWFMASTAPIVVYYFMQFAAEDEDLLVNRPSVQTFFIFAHVLALTNYAANFFLFTFLNHTYRRRLAGLLCRRRRTTSIAERSAAAAPGAAAADAASESNAGWSTALATNVSSGSVEMQPLKREDPKR